MSARVRERRDRRGQPACSVSKRSWRARVRIASSMRTSVPPAIRRPAIRLCRPAPDGRRRRGRRRHERPRKDVDVDLEPLARRLRHRVPVGDDHPTEGSADATGMKATVSREARQRNPLTPTPPPDCWSASPPPPPRPTPAPPRRRKVACFVGCRVVAIATRIHAFRLHAFAGRKHRRHRHDGGQGESGVQSCSHRPAFPSRSLARNPCHRRCQQSERAAVPLRLVHAL